jgi:O-antigen biosynthesis protein WbqP
MKRLLDIFVSLFAILVLIFPFILISILIKFDSKGPILHFSKRIGLDNKIFEMPKFRTMLLSVPQIESNKLKNPSLYITKIGNFLRRYSLDELPQLFLVLFGIMTLVGPRPV